MEKTINKEQNSKISGELLTLKNRSTILIEGVEQVLSSSETSLHLKLKDTKLSILGSGIQITRLDVALKILESDGKFDTIKYGKSGNFFKRFFK